MAHGRVVAVVGEVPPAMSVSWSRPKSPADIGFVVFMADYDLELPDEENPEAVFVCLHCLVEDGDEQLGRGLDLARRHGQVDWDVEREEWFVPYGDPGRGDVVTEVEGYPWPSSTSTDQGGTPCA